MTLLNIYTESAMPLEWGEEPEITLVARSVEELLTLVNNDKIDLDNNWLVTEAQLKRKRKIDSE